MSTSRFIQVVLPILLIVVLVALSRRRTGEAGRPRRLISMGVALVVCGLLAGEEPLLRYGLIGAGAAAAVTGLLQGRRQPPG